MYACSALCSCSGEACERGYGKTGESLVSSEYDVIVKFSKPTRDTFSAKKIKRPSAMVLFLKRRCE